MKLMGTVRLRQMKEWEKYIYLERERERGKKQRRPQT